MQESKKVVNFGRIKSKIPLPNLIELQLTSYEWFLQPKTTKRKSQGLQAVFEEIFPIESPHDDVVLEFVNYEIGRASCRERV